MKNKIKIIVITALGIILVLIGIFLLKLKLPKNNNDKNTYKKEVFENMSKVSSYNISIYLKNKEKDISTTGNIKRTKGFNYFRGTIDLDSEGTKSNNKTDIEYIFDLTEQRYKQNIYYKDALLSSNIYDSNENNQNIDLIDSTAILSYLSELLNNEITICQKNICKLSLSKTQIDRLSLLLVMIVNQQLYLCLENEEKVEAVFKIENKKKEIEEVALITPKKATINIKFTSFKF